MHTAHVATREHPRLGACCDHDAVESLACSVIELDCQIVHTEADRAAPEPPLRPEFGLVIRQRCLLTGPFSPEQLFRERWPVVRTDEPRLRCSTIRWRYPSRRRVLTAWSPASEAPTTAMLFLAIPIDLVDESVWTCCTRGVGTNQPGDCEADYTRAHVGPQRAPGPDSAVVRLAHVPGDCRSDAGTTLSARFGHARTAASTLGSNSAGISSRRSSRLSSSSSSKTSGASLAQAPCPSHNPQSTTTFASFTIPTSSSCVSFPGVP